MVWCNEGVICLICYDNLNYKWCYIIYYHNLYSIDGLL